jgi:NADH:ubiquinone oxidoreductase subunit 4 (subunit M)
MESTYAALLSFIVFLPALGALVVGLLVPKDKPDVAKLLSLACTAVVLVATIWIALPGGDGQGQTARFEIGRAGMQDVFNFPWIPTFNIYYFMGVDGISFPLVILTAFIFFLSMWASWNIDKHVKAYCVLFLLLETGVLGVFFALDFFLFFMFWEVMLLPMYFLIGLWGGPRREYAAIKFFLYTLLGGALMLIAVLMLYFNSDLRALAQHTHSDFRANESQTAQPVKWSDLHIHPDVEAQLGKTSTRERDIAARVLFFRSRLDTASEQSINLRLDRAKGGEANSEKVGVTVATDDPHVARVTVALADGATAKEVVTALNRNAQFASLLIAKLPPGSEGTGVVQPRKLELPPYNPTREVHTFNLLALMAMGQHTDLFNSDKSRILGWTIQTWAFLLLFIGFAIKVPSVPLHTWLPDAHVEAPTPISMILAGILLKLGGYGIIRICYPICPEAGFDLAWFVCIVGVVSMIYGAFAAMAQKDFKRLVAYSSVSHMGYVVLGLGVWSAASGNSYSSGSSGYWSWGVNGAMFQMIAHGISSPGMFFLVGVVYDRVHHRNLDEFGGLFRRMPVYSGMSIAIFFAGLGLPGLCGFIGEFFVTLSAWNFSRTLAVLSAGVVILTAGYILWTIQRVYLGPEYKGPHGEHLHEMSFREKCIGAPLVAFAILLGVYPRAVFDYMTPSVDQSVRQLTQWQKLNRPEPVVAEAGEQR